MNREREPADAPSGSKPALFAKPGVLDRVREVLEGEPGGERDLEAGGLLLGAAGDEIRIEDLLALPIEHRFGPAFWLSTADIEEARRKVDSSRGGVIGHFRSCKFDNAEISDVDNVLANLAPVAEPVLLLVPFTGKRPSAWILYRRSGDGWTKLRDLAPDTGISAAPSVRRVARRILVPRRRVPLSEAVALFALLLGAVMMLWRQAAGPGRGSGPPNLGLAVQAAAGSMRATWNRSDPAVLHAAAGVMRIRDGATTREIDLSPDHLRNGGITYLSNGDRVEFEMEIFGNGVGHSLASAKTLAILPATARPGPAAIKLTREVPAPSLVASAESPVPAPRTSREKRAAASSESARRATRHGKTKSLNASRSSRETVPVRTQPLPAPAQVSTAQPAGIREASRSIPAPDASARGYSAAMPMHRASATLPANLRAQLDGPVTVGVKVTIDANGNVVRAAPEDVSQSAQKLVSPHAVQAALKWRFQPARRNGRPVSSETVLKFAFDRR